MKYINNNQVRKNKKIMIYLNKIKIYKTQYQQQIKQYNYKNYYNKHQKKIMNNNIINYKNKYKI